LTHNLPTAIGKKFFVEEENYLVWQLPYLALSAYVFLFMTMVDAGVHLGHADAERPGPNRAVSVDYYRKRLTHLARLRNEVTSPGGATFAGYISGKRFPNRYLPSDLGGIRTLLGIGTERRSHPPEKTPDS
jgi:pyrroline-5-carboxylate reductase